MINIKKIFSLTIFSLLLFINIVHGQYIPETKTQFSRTNGQGIESENYSFSMSKGILKIVNLDNGLYENYGPLTHHDDGYDKGSYYEGYMSDIRQNPLRYRNEKPRAYKFYYDKTGNIIAILEGKIRQDNSQIIKIYYTKIGNRLLNEEK